MDQRELQQKIAYYFEKLPLDVQQIFSSMTWVDTLKGIAEKYRLTSKGTEILTTEVTMIMLGVIDKPQFIDDLEDEIEMTSEAFERMIDDIDHSILDAIKPQLEEAYGKNIEEGQQDERFEQELDERFTGLPAEVQQALVKSEYQSVLFGIGKEHNLTVEQMGLLEESINNVILGAIKPENFGVSLRNTLKINPETIHEMVEQINERILKEVRAKMIAAYKEPLPTKDEKEQHEVLKSAGIEIVRPMPVSEPLELTAPMTTIPLPPKIDTPTPVPQAPTPERPIIVEKFGSTSSTPIIKTEYSLGNMSNGDKKPEIMTPKPSVTSYGQHKDPYRLSPEE